MSVKYDYLIVGAGFSGLVLAERLSTQLGKTCLIVEQRDHIGGNCYDEKDQFGLLLHTYGPHYFRTNSQRIIDYLSKFTDWNHATYRVKSFTDGHYWSFPINLYTYEQLIGRKSTEAEFIDFLNNVRVPIEHPINSEQLIISQVGYQLFNKFFRGYTLKQWKKEPSQLDPSVCGRIPIRTNYDERYFSDKFQALPAEGYTRMFQRMLATTKHVEILLKTEWREIQKHVTYGHLIYTGSIDSYYDHIYGALPYRSLKFEREGFTKDQLVARQKISGKTGFWQPALQINYPNDHDFTRIVELKHATGQISENTTIVREYPHDYIPGSTPYYPIPMRSSQLLYERYAELAKLETKVSFIGRLATYRYYNMDQVVGMALTEFERLKQNASTV